LYSNLFAPTYVIVLFHWIKIATLTLNFSLLCDNLSNIMLLIITVIASIVIIYATEYMQFDPHLPRFLCYLNLFTFFMLILISSNNFIQFFIGWEGIGLCSFLLISFWYTRSQAIKAGLKAIILNRFGDISLILGFCILFNYTYTFDFNNIFILYPFIYQLPFITFNSIEIQIGLLVSFFFLISIIAKSAQIGLHTWLPDAMEGPTPVSALLHAATMVTAGVFLLLRCSLFFDTYPLILTSCIIIGFLTILCSGLIGIHQTDIKKIIAYSTCSQLGFMVLLCGFSAYNLAFFHLFNHAFF